MGYIVYYSPRWFYGYDIILEVLFALITLTVAVYAFRVYRLSDQRDSKLFGSAFLLISISYSLWALLNGFAVSELGNARTILELEQANIWRYLGIYAHILFFLSGIATLTYMTLKVRSAKIYSLLLIFVIVSVLLVDEKYLITYLLSTIMLLYVIGSYINEYGRNKNKKVFSTLLAFVFLLLGGAEFIFSPSRNTFYVLGHILELAAYGLILVSLIPAIKQRKIIP